jgi:hypothetical protein
MVYTVIPAMWGNINRRMAAQVGPFSKITKAKRNIRLAE